MKQALIIYLLLFLIHKKCFSEKDTTVNPISVEIKVNKEYTITLAKDYCRELYLKYHYEMPGDSVFKKLYDVEVIIKNNSIKSIFLWLMTCSWADNFIVNNNYIFMRGQSCDSNFPTIVEFKPGESRIYNTTLSKDIKFDYPPKGCVYGPQVEATKLGLITFSDISKKDYSIDYHVAIVDKSLWKIIWSNPLNLLGKQPEPKVIGVYKN